MVIKGQALVRIPYDNLKKRMTVRQYFQYIYNNYETDDPLELKGMTNPNILVDYNLGNANVSKIKQEFNHKETFIKREEQNRKVNQMFNENTNADGDAGTVFDGQQLEVKKTFSISPNRKKSSIIFTEQSEKQVISSLENVQ